MLRGSTTVALTSMTVIVIVIFVVSMAAILQAPMRVHGSIITPYVPLSSTQWNSELFRRSLGEHFQTKDIFNEKKTVIYNRKQHGGGNDAARKLQTNNGTTTTEEDCLDAPFLWLIRNDNDNGKVEGLGVGTMHLERRFVVTDLEWQSLVNAAADGCTVYGEFDLTDPLLLQELATSCVIAPIEPTFVADLPDLELRAILEDAILQIVNEYTMFGGEQVADSILTGNPIDVIFQLITYWNSNDEFRDDFFEDIFNGVVAVDFLDTNLLDLGFESASLESIEESCTYVNALTSPSRDEFLANWDELYADKARAKLDDSFDGLIDAYQCGRIEGINEMFVENLEDSVWGDSDQVLTALIDGTYLFRDGAICIYILNRYWPDIDIFFLIFWCLISCFSPLVRNIAISERIVAAMEFSEHVPMFAVGVAHWFVGENSLANLLQQKGYSLERVDTLYDPDLFPDPVCSGGTSTEGTEEPIATIESTPTPVTSPTFSPAIDPPTAAEEPIATDPTASFETANPVISPTIPPSTETMEGLGNAPSSAPASAKPGKIVAVIGFIVAMTPFVWRY
jgi:hypothetical protein